MKQTEIGLIPDDWEVKRLGELFEMRAGGDVNKQHFSYYKSDKYKYKIFSNGLENEGVYGFTDLPRYKGDSITITRRGTVGVSMYRKDDFDAVIRLLVLESRNKNQTNNFFISELINEVVKFPNESTGVPQLTVPQIKDVLIPLPPLPEQQRIAKALSDMDALISTTEKLLQKKNNIKQGAMQNLLTGKKRLPGFAKSTNYKQAELGLIPEDWEVKNINKECTIKARIGWQGLKSTEYLDSGDYILITGTDFDSGFINWKSCSYVTKWRFDQDKNIQIKQGDVLITKDGTIGKVAFLNEIPMQGTLNSGVFVIRPKNPDKMDSVFLSLIFKSFWFDAFLEQITSGSTIVHLYQKDFVKFNFPLPSKEEQTAIANVLSSMDKEIETLNTKLEKYRNLKTAMMQQLLTGKIRLVK